MRVVRPASLGRHQITSANETTTPGYFTSSYRYGTGGRFTNVNIAQPTPPFGSEVKPRSVNYQYADADPERVTSLTKVGTTIPYATDVVRLDGLDEAANLCVHVGGARLVEANDTYGPDGSRQITLLDGRAREADRLDLRRVEHHGGIAGRDIAVSRVLALTRIGDSGDRARTVLGERPRGSDVLGDGESDQHDDRGDSRLDRVAFL